METTKNCSVVSEVKNMEKDGRKTSIVAIVLTLMSIIVFLMLVIIIRTPFFIFTLPIITVELFLSLAGLVIGIIAIAQGDKKGIIAIVFAVPVIVFFIWIIFIVIAAIR